MKILNQLFVIEQTWIGSTLTLLVIVALLIVRHFLSATQRKRARVPLIFLSLAFVLGLSATATLQVGAYTLWGLLSFLCLLSLIVGITSVVSLVAFDLLLNRTRVRVPALVRDLIHVTTILLIVLTILDQRGLDPLSLLTTSAVLTAVIGLALQNTIANVFAGLSLHLERTFGISDWIQIGEKIGRILEIKWRSTLLCTEEGDLLIVPNRQLLDVEVLNFSRPDSVQRMEIKVGFHYRHPPNEVKRVLLDAIRDTPGTLAEPQPDCVLSDFADSAVVYRVRYWINDYSHHTPIESEVRTRIWYAAHRAGLEIPFPIRTIVMPAPTLEMTATSQRNGFASHQAALTQTGLFTMLDEEARAMLVAKMKTVEFGAGEDILREGESGALHVIRSGEVAISLTLDGIRHELATLKSGDFFGELALMTDEARPVRYVAKSDTICSVVDHAVLGQLLAAHPQFAEEFSAALAAREMALDGERRELSAEAQARRMLETKSRLLTRIQRVFRTNLTS